jgi:hypothetical protein
MVDLYGAAPRYTRMKASIPRWGLLPANQRALEALLTTRLERASPSRRYSDLIQLRRAFCGLPRTGKPALLVGALANYTLLDFERVADTLREEARRGQLGRATFKRLTSLIRGLYTQVTFLMPKSSRSALAQRLGDVLAWPSDIQANQSVTAYYTADEFLRLLRVARRPQERALLALAWETTARPNEYLSLRVGDVEATAHGFTLKAHVSKQQGGVTRTRNLYVLAFRADFAAFWNTHPYRDDPGHTLFFRDDNARHRGAPLGPAGANLIVKRYDALSGLRKGGTLYWLRHGGYTAKILAGMKTALAGADMGWTPGSRQAHRYTHILDSDILAERLRLAGHHFAHQIQPQLQARICPACNQPNTPAAEHCTTCGQRLNLADVLRELEELKANQAGLVEHAVRKFLREHRHASPSKLTRPGLPSVSPG